MSTDTQWDKLQEIGRNAMASIAEMVAALNCDYDRLQELRDERDGYEPECICKADEHGPDTCDHDCGCPECWDTWDDGFRKSQWAKDNADDAEELAELTEAAGECESREDAEQRIQEDPLSLEFRSGWVSSKDEMEPEEFCLLLSTGGPAVRIIGEIRDGEPHRPVLQTQDWGTVWTEYTNADRDVLLDYCRVFYFDA
jgi:hypothetical protein